MENTINTWKVIKTEEEYDKALDRLEFIFDAIPGSAEFDEVELLGLLINDYEDKHYHISLPDPIEAVKLKMEELGLNNNDLKLIFGSIEQVTTFLNKQEKLTLEKAQNLHYWLNIPSAVFMDSDDSISSNSNFIKTNVPSKNRIQKLKELSLDTKSAH